MGNFRYKNHNDHNLNTYIHIACYWPPACCAWAPLGFLFRKKKIKGHHRPTSFTLPYFGWGHQPLSIQGTTQKRSIIHSFISIIHARRKLANHCKRTWGLCAKLGTCSFDHNHQVVFLKYFQIIDGGGHLALCWEIGKLRIPVIIMQHLGVHY